MICQLDASCSRAGMRLLAIADARPRDICAANSAMAYVHQPSRR